MALWATQQLLPLTKDGAFAEGLRKGRRAALELDRRVRADERFVGLVSCVPGSPIARDPGHPNPSRTDAGQPNFSSSDPRHPHPPELDIVVWALRAADLGKGSELTRKVFDACARRGLHLALVELPGSWFGVQSGAGDEDQTMTCLRSVLMKPEHEAWMGEIWERLCAACDEVLGTRG